MVEGGDGGGILVAETRLVFVLVRQQRRLLLLLSCNNASSSSICDLHCDNHICCCKVQNEDTSDGAGIAHVILSGQGMASNAQPAIPSLAPSKKQERKLWTSAMSR